MVTIQSINSLTSKLENVEQLPHFEKISFRVKKKIFLTVSPDGAKATLKLSLVDQDVFHKYDPLIFYPVPNAWGKQGWTVVELQKVRSDMFKDALVLAYKEVLSRGISKKALK